MSNNSYSIACLSDTLHPSKYLENVVTRLLKLQDKCHSFDANI